MVEQNNLINCINNYIINNDKNQILSQSFKDDLEMDSLDVMELAMCCENKYSINLSNEDIVACKTLKELGDLCKKQF